MLSGRVHHVSLNVTDTAAAERFYVEVLGLRPIERPDLGFPGAWLSVGEQEVHLLEVEGFEPPKGQHFAFQVDDLDAAIDQIRSHGVEVSEPRAIEGVCRQAFLSDPTGNLLELNEPARR